MPKVPVDVIFSPSPDHDASVTSYVLDVYREGDSVSDGPVITANLGKPAVAGDEILINLDATMDQVSGGTYFMVLRAVGPGGSSPNAVSPLFSK